MPTAGRRRVENRHAFTKGNGNFYIMQLAGTLPSGFQSSLLSQDLIREES